MGTSEFRGQEELSVTDPRAAGQTAEDGPTTDKQERSTSTERSTGAS